MKADARAVEQALTLLAAQFDQATRMSSLDFERVRVAMVKFLELSPDVRKAALSLGLQGSDPCVVCHAKPMRRDLRGHDAKYYGKLDGAAETDAHALTRRIVDEQLGFPPRLASSRAVAQELQARGALPSLKELLAQTEDWLAGSRGHAAKETGFGREKVALRTFFPAAAGSPAQSVADPESGESLPEPESPRNGGQRASSASPGDAWGRADSPDAS